MSSTELQREQAHVDRAYARLEALRARARAVASVHAQERGGTHQGRYEHDVTDYVSARRLAALELGSLPLVFGRIDCRDGERWHIGRIAVHEDDFTPLVVDWRARAAEPFYRATPRQPLGLVRRRHFRARGPRLLGLDDERFGWLDAHDDELTVVGEAALLEALARSRTGRMTDIVATIQAEQDAVIRAPLAGILVVQGGPGTGKTAVALHRAAYLLYTHRIRLERSGVLLIGPTPVFLRYIEEVLPSLGEQRVRLATVSTLMSGITATATDPPSAARLKGDPRMATLLARAAAEEPARPAGGPQWLLWDLLGSPARIERAADGLLSADEQADLFRGDWQGWTEEDLPLLDELAALLGPPPRRPQRPQRPRLEEAQRRELERFVAELADVHPMDEVMHRDILARVIAARENLEDHKDEVEHATYGHVLVDEAQDLSPMAWRMVARRCPSGSMTIVGDLGQATGLWSPRSWEEITALLPGVRRERARGDAPGNRVTVAELTINYRTPAEIMAFADQLRPPRLQPTRPVRRTGVSPIMRQVRTEELDDEVAAAVREALNTVEGTIGVLAPTSLLGQLRRAAADPDARVTTSSVLEAKGLEFDAVVVVEPAAVVREHGAGQGEDPDTGQASGLRALYVALTRATQRLAVLSTEELPPDLTSLG